MKRWLCPRSFRARIARNTQLVIQEETGITNVVDPLAGSYYVESLTDELVQSAREMIDEVEELGGMTKAVETGMPKLRIEEAAAQRQARIDRGEEVIVGVNKYQLEVEPEMDVLDIDNSAVRESQVARLEQVRSSRDAQACEQALEALKQGAASVKNLSGSGGQMRPGPERPWVRYLMLWKPNGVGIRPRNGRLVGVYSAAYEGDEGFMTIKNKVEAFAETHGRRPRMLVVKMGQDGHDRGAKVIATAFADLGFDVDVGPMFQTPEEAAQQAIENDVHIVGVSSQAAGHKTLVPQLIASLREQGAEEIIVICGGVIPPKDYDQLRADGVAAIFGPGTNIPEAAEEVLGLIG